MPNDGRAVTDDEPNEDRLGRRGDDDCELDDEDELDERAELFLASDCCHRSEPLSSSAEDWLPVWLRREGRLLGALSLSSAGGAAEEAVSVTGEEEERLEASACLPRNVSVRRLLPPLAALLAVLALSGCTLCCGCDCGCCSLSRASSGCRARYTLTEGDRWEKTEAEWNGSVDGFHSGRSCCWMRLAGAARHSSRSMAARNLSGGTIVK